MDSKEAATSCLTRRCKEVDEGDCELFKKFARTVKVHWHGISNFCEMAIDNGIVKGINSKI